MQDQFSLENGNKDGFSLCKDLRYYYEDFSAASSILSVVDFEYSDMSLTTKIKSSLTSEASVTISIGVGFYLDGEWFPND